MALAAGTRLGQYEVVSALGAGGMGEVYRARDTQLGRDVALKVLPAGFADEPQRLARFEREARVLAGLNHANIATLYGFFSAAAVPGGGTGRPPEAPSPASAESEASGSAAKGATPFLVMEVVEGETLAERIKRGALEIDEASALFRQIAAGLEAAHERGVIHRDLKPANIKLTPEGVVKILDFGLARALAADAESPQQDPALSPTLTHDVTQRGEILGTAFYMSPEQAQGAEADQRADVWAFGCCLFEALSGERPFDGENASLVLASVLKEEPHWQALEALGQPLLVRLVQRCLRKDPRQRYHHAADLRIVLEDMRSSDVEVRPVAARRPWWLVAAALLGALGVGWGLSVWRSPSISRTAPVVFDIPLPLGITFTPESTTQVALTPEGDTVLWSAEERGRLQLYQRKMEGVEISKIAGTEGAVSPIPSADGQWVAFWVDGELRKVELSGGVAVTLAALPRVQGGRWAADGKIYAACEDALYVVSSSGGEPRQLASRQLIANALGSEQRTDLRGWADETGGLVSVIKDGEDWIAAWSSSGAVDLVTRGTGPWLSHDGRTLAFARGDQVFASGFDADSRTVNGELRAIATGVQRDIWSYPQMAFDERGSMAWVPAGAVASGEMVLVDHSGRVVRALAELPGMPERPRLSPDSRTVALGSQDPRAQDYSLLLIDLDRGSTRELSGERFWWSPVWAPGGRKIYFSALRGGRYYITEMEVDSTSSPHDVLELPATDNDLAIDDVSHDGRWLVYSRSSPSAGSDLHALDLATSQSRVLRATPEPEIRGRLSPDGRWLIYETRVDSTKQVALTSFPESTLEVPISVEGGVNPVWSADGSKIFYRRGTSVMEVDFEVGPRGPVLGTAQELFSGPYRPVPSLFDYDAQAEHFLLIRYSEEQRPRIRVARNILGD